MALSLGGCESVGYYGQSVRGHLDMMARREQVSEVIEDSRRPEAVRRTLQRVAAIRDFASVELLLPDNESYRSYANLERSAAVWTVVAAPEFSLQPKQWCYLVIGCASYRGYFAREAAHAYALDLDAQGYDVVVVPVPAYSTLGWFDDPVPSTVIDWPEPRLAALIFHELAHQKLYVKDDSAFNEAFATLVAEVGVERWLLRQGGRRQIEDWAEDRRRRVRFLELLLNAKRELASLYGQPLAETELRRRKAASFKRLRSNYLSLKQEWEGDGRFDAWFERDLNNAVLASIATYRQWVPALERLLQESGGELRVFYRRAEELAGLPLEKRRKRLRRLLGPVPARFGSHRPSVNFPQLVVALPLSLAGK